MTSVQWCSRFLYGSFSRTSRRRGESGCPGFYVHAELHLGKRTSGRLPLCAAGYILRREETQFVCRDVIWCARCLKNMDLWNWGNLEWTWMQRHSGSHYIVLKAWSATDLDCCSRAMRITKVVVVGFFCPPKDSSNFVAALYLHTFTYAIYLWTMQVDKAWFSSLSSKFKFTIAKLSPTYLRVDTSLSKRHFLNALPCLHCS